MKRPEFTQEQEQWLCEVLDDWYLCFKQLLQHAPGRFGWAKELLKLRICDDPIMQEIYDEEKENK